MIRKQPTLINTCEKIADWLIFQMQSNGIVSRQCPVGEIIFLYEMFNVTSDNKYIKAFVTLLDAALHNNPEEKEGFFLYDSYAALAASLANYSLISATTEYSKLLYLTKHELEFHSNTLEAENFDPLFGRSGLIYLNSLIPNDTISRHLSMFLSGLSGCINASEKGLVKKCNSTIKSGQWNNLDTDVHDLGLAHGNAGIIAILSRLSSASKHRMHSQCTSLASTLTSSMKNLHYTNSISRFPNVAEIEETSRTGWCYGDLSIAVGFANFGYLCHNLATLAEARKMAGEAIVRTLETNSVMDFHICHGKSGILAAAAYIFGPESLQPENKNYQTISDALHLEVETASFFRENISTDLLEGYSGLGLHLLGSNVQSNSWRSLCFM